MPIKPIKVAIVDESFLFAKILKNFLMESRNVQVIMHALNLADLEKKMEELSPDILLMDIMPQPNAFDTLKVVKEKYPDMKIIILSMCRDLNVINSLLNMGIHAYISKMDEPEGLLEAITCVADGRFHRSSIVTETLYWDRQKAGGNYNTTAIVSLNSREKKLLQLLWEEKSNKEIANEFFLSTKSIEKIRQDLKEKLGVKSTVGLLKYAIGNNIISVGTIGATTNEERACW